MDDLFRLAAIEDIKRCKARYIRGTDTMDWPLFGSAFTEDAVWDLRGFAVARRPWDGEWNNVGAGAFDFAFLDSLSAIVPWPVTGRAAIARAAGDHTKWAGSFHALFNPEIEILTEDTARASWPFEDTLHFPEGAPIRQFNGFAYYHETYERIDGEWLIRTCTLQRLLCSMR